MLAGGEGLPEIAPYLAGASLVAGKKDDGGVRPIACGEVLRRLVGKCWMKSEPIKDEIKRLLEPRQLGVGCAGGAEAIVHAVQAVLHEKKTIRIMRC